MDKIGDIEIRVIGKSGSKELHPDNYDIRHIASILQNVEELLYPNNKKDRPLLTYNIQEGSVRHIFKTPAQYVIGFSAVLAQVQATQSIDFLDLKTARALENIQKLSIEKDYSFEFNTSVNEGVALVINPQTHFYRTENIWVDAEFYFYGILTNAGGKSKANIHLDTSEFGSLTLNTNKDFLEGQEENLLYKQFGVRVIGKQNAETGEIDTKSLELIELIDYEQKYNSEYLSTLISKAKKSWKGVKTDDWLFGLRGDYEA
ncbi:MAG: hypothetical protein KDC92_00400 [Bacteroidetes bacterium]|nr:hypothetical protein [Bacteroidota bacterium]